MTRTPRPAADDVATWTRTAASPRIRVQGKAFDGIVKGVHLAIADAAENSGHLISPEEIARVAMPRQQLTGIQ